MKIFKSWSIQEKLTRLMLFISFTALLLASVSFLAYMGISAAHSSFVNMTTIARIVGTNCVAALTFNDADAAKETLLALRNVSDIRSAFVLRRDGSLFTAYYRNLQIDGEKAETRSELEDIKDFKEGFTDQLLQAFRDNDLDVSELIRLDGELIGRIFISYDLKSIYRSILVGVMIALGILLFFFTFSYFLARRLHPMISHPIMTLHETMVRVSREKNYNLRAIRETDDELGTLVDGFNGMLFQIQQRDVELDHHRRNLEEIVVQRTKELSNTNMKLENTVDKLRKAKEEAETASRAKSQFLANMSHEIRTPMNGVLGMTQLLQQTALDDRQRNMLNTVMTSGESLLSVINDILDFSKIEVGRLELNSICFDLRELLEDVTMLFAETAQKKGLELICHVESDVPDRIWGDPDRVRQVLLNLLNNAVKFTQKGEVVCRVRCRKKNHDEASICIELRDTGIGIPKDKQAIIFDPFSQADESTTRNYGGTGLGLAIARQLVTLMGGTLKLDSTPEKGSTFQFLNRFKVDRWKAERDLSADLFLKELRLLIVDDHPINREILHHTLEGWEIKTSEAEDGFKALDALRQASVSGRPFDVVLLDMNMPGMNGLEVARKLKNDPTFGAPQVVMLSSMIAAVDETKEENGISYFLTKPVASSSLYDCLVGFDHTRETACKPIKPDVSTPTVSIPVSSRVLIAEDNAVNQKYCQSALELFGCQVETVCDGKQAVESSQRNQYDLIFMDCQMPEMDGYEATAELRRLENQGKTKRPHTPIVALTAHAVKGDREKCLAAGMDDYLSKPFTIPQIKTVLKRWLFRVEEEEANARPTESKGTDLKLFSKENLGTVKASSNKNDGVPVLDKTSIDNIKQLQKPGRENILIKMIQLYLSRTPELIQELHDSLANGDMTTFHRAAHSLKSTSATMGAMKFSELARTLEFMAKENQREALDSVLEQLDTAHDLVQVLLKKELEHEGHPCPRTVDDPIRVGGSYE